ncbi:hypothetical protein BLNAU_5574 [Blattamonas nauphoetae]|uniref:Uncharacterized protein n=1 Tax=Blattamonas nauphoetae TaxID=2049346 RepID=A0ABQ9Y760_9EUKA|nr:hypothetical protein BLNAU_5574 [Blattamonas nauphoetae]
MACGIMDILCLIVSFIFPPLGICMMKCCGSVKRSFNFCCHLIINIILMCCAWIPGFIHCCLLLLGCIK